MIHEPGDPRRSSRRTPFSALVACLQDSVHRVPILHLVSHWPGGPFVEETGPGPGGVPEVSTQADGTLKGFRESADITVPGFSHSRKRPKAG